MNEHALSELLTSVIAAFALVASLSWLLMAKPLAIFKHASARFSAANFFIGSGMVVSLYRVDSDPIVFWLISDIALFFGVFLYKKAIYKLFRLPNSPIFDHFVLGSIALITLFSIIFTVEYQQIAIIITLICSATCAMTVYAKYHSLVNSIPRYIATLLVLPIFILSAVLFIKCLTLWLIPERVETLFLQRQVDALPILWIYLITFILVNIFASGAALMLLILKIKKLADHDQLTGLFNRHAITRELNRAHKLFHRDTLVFSVLLIDVDFFKRVNDTKGHDAGDAAIKHVAKLMTEELRESDSLARYGGEEFLALLTNCDLTRAEAVAEKLRTKIEKTPFSWNQESYFLTVSIGACCISQVEDLKTLVMRADKALYNAKETGRNRISLA